MARLVKKSPAEFFSENKNIAGFDNPGKALYTTIREFVENGLDAAETAGELPDIDVVIEEYTESEFANSFGGPKRKRNDEKLYADYETEKEKTKRINKEARENSKELKRLTKEAEMKGLEGEDAVAHAKAKLSASQVVKDKKHCKYRVTCTDNGCGMKFAEIPEALGRVLTGSKYEVKQNRGKYGLGSKMALIWAKQTTGQPVKIKSATPGSAHVSVCHLDIDIKHNEPNALVHKQAENTDRWHGTEISVVIDGAWSSYRSKIMQYFRGIAVITPYAQFALKFVPADGGKELFMKWSRRSDTMPTPPKVAKHHPSSIDLVVLSALADHTKAKTMESFLSREFQGISSSLAKKFCEKELHFVQDSQPRDLSMEEKRGILDFLREARVDAPDGKYLSPAGEYNLRLGILQQLQSDADMVATHTGSVKVFEGHAFIVEAGVSIGGDLKPGINVFRFANRIPLLFEAGGDVVTRTANKRINWNSYKIRPTQDKIGVFVSIVSTKIPFKGTGKEYIGDDVEPMRDAVADAIRHCCNQLKKKISYKNQMKSREDRKRNLTKYIPDVTRAFMQVFEASQERRKRRKKSSGNSDDGLNSELSTILKDVDQKTLARKLEIHVEKVDDALETQVTGGQKTHDTEDFYLAPRPPLDVLLTKSGLDLYLIQNHVTLL